MRLQPPQVFAHVLAAPELLLGRRSSGAFVLRFVRLRLLVLLGLSILLVVESPLAVLVNEVLVPSARRTRRFSLHPLGKLQLTRRKSQLRTDFILANGQDSDASGFYRILARPFPMATSSRKPSTSCDWDAGTVRRSTRRISASQRASFLGWSRSSSPYSATAEASGRYWTRPPARTGNDSNWLVSSSGSL